MPPTTDEQPAEEGAPAWMATYGDMVTLLLTFFIMLYALSLLEEKPADADQTALERVIAAISSRFGAEITIMEQPEAENLIPMDPNDSLIEMLELNLMTEAMGTIKIEAITGGVKVTLPGELLFDFGEEDLREEAKGTLDIFVDTVLKSEQAYEILVQGHTDNVPVRQLSDRYRDNLELSCLRAANVARYFIDQHGIDPKTICAEGKGEWHPVDPDADNSSEEARAQNRRVEIYLLEGNPFGVAREERRASRTAADIAPPDNEPPPPVDSLLNGTDRAETVAEPTAP